MSYTIYGSNVNLITSLIQFTHALKTYFARLRLFFNLKKLLKTRLLPKMAWKASQETNGECASSFQEFENLERYSDLEIKIAELTEENSELFVALQSERRKSKQLQSELHLHVLHERSSELNDVSSTAHESAEEFLQKVVSKLRRELVSKENECEVLEEKLSAVNQELTSQAEELARTTSELQHQINHLHELLAQERDLNSQLSEESDQTVRDLETKIQQKDGMNMELKVIQGEASERIQSIEKECRFYQTKLKETEKRLSEIVSEQEQRVLETDSVSSQVSESELHTIEENENESHETKTFYEIFTALWAYGDVELNGLRNEMKYKISIFNLIQNGFRDLRSNNIG